MKQQLEELNNRFEVRLKGNDKQVVTKLVKMKTHVYIMYHMQTKI